MVLTPTSLAHAHSTPRRVSVGRHPVERQIRLEPREHHEEQQRHHREEKPQRLQPFHRGRPRQAAPDPYVHVIPPPARAAGSPVPSRSSASAVSYTHLRAHETVLDLVCRLLLEKK